MTITPQDIQNKEFREAFRGYNQDEVDTFLDDIAEEYGQLAQQLQRLKLELAAKPEHQRPASPLPTISPTPGSATSAQPPASAPPPMRSNERAEAREEMKRALVATQRAAEAALDEAKRRAAEIVARAEQRAKEIDEMTARRAKDVDVDAGSALTHAQERVEELKRQESELRARLRRMLAEHIKMLQQLEGEAIEARVPQESGSRGALWLSPREPRGIGVTPPSSAPPEQAPQQTIEPDQKTSLPEPPTSNGMVARMTRALGDVSRPIEKPNGTEPVRNGLGGPDKRDSFWRR